MPDKRSHCACHVRALRTFPIGWPDTHDSDMDLESLNSQIAALHDGDEAVGCALNELQIRLERWFDAMRDGQAAVSGVWQHLLDLQETAQAAQPSIPANETVILTADQETDKASAPDEQVLPDVETADEVPTPEMVEADTAAEPDAQESEATVQSQEPASEVIDAAEDATEIDEPAEASAPPAAVSQAAKPEIVTQRGLFQKQSAGQSAVVADMEPSPATSGDQSGQPEDDEALLASLDEQTQAAIRVKRRLCGNRRSVRELLEDIQREKPAEQSKPQQRKSWWR